MARVVKVIMLMAIGVAWSASTTPALAAERTFPLNLKQSPIDKLIKRVAEETARPIIFDERVRGNISVVTKREVTEGEAWGILEASLSMLGFSLLPSTVDNWRIAKVAEAVGEAPFKARAGPESDSFVTTLISLDNANLQSVIAVLEPISGARVTLVPFVPTNSVIASGPERAIARLASIADELDRVEELALRYRVLRYRDVKKIEDLVEARVKSMGNSARLLQVWTDEQTNSVLFRGAEESVSRLARFLERIDRPSTGSGRIQVLRVLNRDAEEMATLLSELSQSPASAKNVASIRTRGSELVGADYSIAVDKATRSLVVRASPEVQLAIRDMLEELDQPPQLIAVDVTITEVRTPRSKFLGFAFDIPLTASTGSGDLIGRLVSSPVPGATVARLPGPETTLFGRVARDTGIALEGPDDENGIPTVIPIEDTGVIQAGDFSIETEVLIRPHLIVLSGERHELFVGQNVPVPVTEGSPGEADPNSVFGVSLARTIRFDRTDIGIRLGLDAKAGREGKIQIDLDIEISTIIPSLAGAIEQVGPSFLEETLTATARLEHGETAIIGLNRDVRTVVGRSGVPWLSEIPFLGWFFTANSTSEQDVNLAIAVRARRLSSPADVVADTIRRRLIFERQNARGGGLVVPEGLPFGVLVTTREREDDAEAIAEGLMLAGYESTVHAWSSGEGDFFDVYVVSFETMADAAEAAGALMHDGWNPDLVILKTQS